MTDFLVGLGSAGEKGFSIHQPQFLVHALEPLGINNMIMTQWAIVLGLIVMAIVINKAVINGRFTRLRGSLELLIDFLEGWYAGFIGGRRNARKYMPLLCTLFLFILVANYLGIIPGAGYLFFAPTGRWGTTLGLAIIVAIAVQVIAIMELGIGGWVKHLLHMFPLGLLEEFVKPFSLSLRLFGNIFGEETLLAVIIMLAPFFAPIPIMGLSLMFGAIQAVVFTTLSAIYIGSILEHAHDHNDLGHAAPAHKGAHAH